jgi:hypothetical protein
MVKWVMTVLDYANIFRFCIVVGQFPFNRHVRRTAQCAPITDADIATCGGVVHLISKVRLLHIQILWHGFHRGSPQLARDR